MIQLTPKHKRNLLRILPFGIIWLIIGWVFLWTEYAVTFGMENPVGAESAISITPVIVFFASVSVFFVGCFVGVIEVIITNRLFSKCSLPIKILGKSLLYIILMLTLISILYMLAASIEMKKFVFSEAVFKRYMTFFFSITNISTTVQLSFSLIISLLYSEISDNLGQNVLLNFFTGKYHKPIVEHRVFMFTDMKNSTAIAEQLGHVTYFEFLKDYYNDLSDAIINNHGEVYQYIGDEIVISWKLKQKNSAESSIHCFFEMKKDLLRRENNYLNRYNFFPDFKGAIHLGEVTTGEIGALKKEIFFTGDVLNTTARMQSLCSVYKSDLLVSESIVEQLGSNSHLNFEHLAEVDLKGKQKKLNLYIPVCNS
ncbi:MAG: adenylate/guanylate cyclase domain-containing protein [Jejuia sp.]